MAPHRVAFAREASWPLAAVNVAVLAASVAIGYMLTNSPAQGAILGAAVFLLYSQLSRNYVLRFHYIGIRALRARQFADAISQFQASYDFLTAHQWLDQLRGLTFLSSSKASYRELALVNIGYCLVQLERFRDAELMYLRIQKEFPSSPHPEPVLKLLRSQNHAP